MRLLVLLALLFVACEPAPPSRGWDMEGFVTEIDFRGESGTGTVLIEEEPDQRSAGAKALVRITERTKILRDIGGVYDPIAFREVVVHPGTRMMARAWFTGPVTRSYPGQAEAVAIVVWLLAP